MNASTICRPQTGKLDQHNSPDQSSDPVRDVGVTRASRQAKLIGSLTESLGCEDFPSAASALNQGLQEILGCQNVVMATACPVSGNVQVVAMLNSNVVNRRAEQPVMIEDAMRQAVVLREALSWSDSSPKQTAQANGLRQLALEMGCSTVFCSPIRNLEGKIVGAFLATNGPQQNHIRPLRRFARYESLFAGCLTAAQEKHESTIARTTRRLRQKIQTKRTVALSLSLVALIVCGILPWQYRLKCDCTCEPVHRRYVAAPFAGTLQTTYVVPGQQVRKGDLLAEMDGRDLRSQLAGLNATLLQAEQRYRAALSSGNASESHTEQLEIRHIKTQTEVLQTQEQELEIRSPLDGVVVSGDLKRVEGVPLDIGQRLYEVAPLSSMIAEVAIAEDEISNVEVGMPTTVTLDADPGKTYRGVIDRIHPRAEMRDGESVFIAEVELADVPSSMLPGMNGTARIESGKRSVGWILFHRPFNAMRRTIGW